MEGGVRRELDLEVPCRHWYEAVIHGLVGDPRGGGEGQAALEGAAAPGEAPGNRAGAKGPGGRGFGAGGHGCTFEGESICGGDYALGQLIIER